MANKWRERSGHTSSESCVADSLLMPRWRVDWARAWRLRVMRVGPMLGGIWVGMAMAVCMPWSLRMEGDCGYGG